MIMVNGWRSGLGKVSVVAGDRRLRCVMVESFLGLVWSFLWVSIAVPGSGCWSIREEGGDVHDGLVGEKKVSQFMNGV